MLQASRRLFLGLTALRLAAVATLAVLAAAAWAGTQAARAAAPAGAQGAMTILVIGDSVAQQIGHGLTQVLATVPGVEVINRGRASTGLVRNDFYDWPAQLDALLAQRRPDVAVVAIGMNDRQPITQGGTHYERFSDAWRALYGERAGRMMERLTAAGVPVIWLGMPIARSGQFSDGMRVINAVFQETAAGRPGVTYVPTWDLTTDEAGRYTPYARDASGRLRSIRTDDGMHFTMHGSMMIAAHVLAVMNRELGLSLTH